jgi:integrase
MTLVNIAFTLGAMGRLRTGKVHALRWDQVDLERRRIHFRESIGGPLKDEDSRMVPIQDSLAPGAPVRRRRVG